MLSCALSAASAQDSTLQLEEVIVTAQKRLQNLRDVPISVAVETAESLQKKGIGNLESLSDNTPSLYLQDGGRISHVAIRGLGSAGTDSVESSVGMYIDGIYFGRSRVSRNPLFDMQRVEVLRGPQGTLYGRNTIAGAINMLTAKPGEEFEARILAEAGNFDTHKLEAYISGAITEQLFARFALLNTRRGNYLDNDAAGPGGGGKDTEGYRGSFRLAPTDKLEITLKYEHMNHENSGSYAQLVANPFNASALQGIANLDLKKDRNQQVSGQGLNDLGDNVGGNFSTDSVALNAVWDFDEGYSLTSVTGWAKYDAVSRDYINASPVNTLTVAGLTERAEYWSQELRLQSPLDRPFHFVAGAFTDYYDVYTLPKPDDVAVLNLAGPVVGPTRAGIAGSELIQNVLVPGRAANVADGFVAGVTNAFTLLTPGGNGAISNFDQAIKTWSVFFEATYEVSDRWHLSAGVRYSEEENKVRLAKGTFYRNADGQPWGELPTGADITARAIANDPALTAADAANLELIYNGTLNSDIGGGNTFADIPGFIAAQGGTPLAKPEPLEEESVTPSLKLQYFYNDAAMLYATLASGFKAGGFNSSNILAFSEDDIFASEDSLAFELGAKLTLAGGAANLNVAVFRTDFDDLQVGTITAQGASTVVNAGSAISQGVELDGSWRLTEAITVGGSYAFLDAKYTDSATLVCAGYLRAAREAAGEVFANSADCTYQLDDQFSGDEALLRAPRHSASVFAEYFTALNDSIDLQLYAAVNYRDKAFTSIENILQTDALTLVNARIALHHQPGNWSLALQGNNLFDDNALVLQQDNSGGAAKGVITTPRTFALQISKQF